MQLMHTELDGVKCLPAGHLAQVDVQSMHVLAEIAPVAREYLPTAQLEQFFEFSAAVYVPGMHSMQYAAANTAEAFPLPQDLHVAAVLALLASEYMPAAQSTQTVDASREYFPRGHTEHRSPHEFEEA